MSRRDLTSEELAIVQAADANRPNCLGCGKSLAPMFSREDIQVPHTWTDVKNRWVEGRLTATEVQTAGHLIRSRISGVYGYGYNGDSVFCTLRCGYQFAVKHARRMGI